MGRGGGSTEEVGANCSSQVMGPWELHMLLQPLFYIFRDKGTPIKSSAKSGQVLCIEKPYAQTFKEEMEISRRSQTRASRDGRGHGIQPLPQSRISASSRNITLKRGQGGPPAHDPAHRGGAGAAA